MKEFDEVFAKYVTEDVVTEEAKKEISTVFEALVNKKVSETIAEKEKTLTEELDAKYEKTFQEEKEQLIESIDSYMQDTAREFVSENKVKIQNTMVVEKAKDIIHGIQKVFEENGISLPETDTDIVKEMNETNIRLNEKVDSLLKENHELRKELLEAEKAIAFIQETKDLSIISREKCMNMMEGMVTESVEDFKTKLDIIKSNLITEKKSKKVNEDDDEYVDDIDDMSDKKDEKDGDDSDLENEGCDSKKSKVKKEACGSEKETVKEWLSKFHDMTN